MCEHERIYSLLNADTNWKKIREKMLFEEKGEWRIKEKTKIRLLNCSHNGELKGPRNVKKKTR